MRVCVLRDNLVLQGRSLLESTAINFSFPFLSRVFSLHSCNETPLRLLLDTSVRLPPLTQAFFDRILREHAAIMSAPNIYPEPPELASILRALKKSETVVKDVFIRVLSMCNLNFVLRCNA